MTGTETEIKVAVASLADMKRRLKGQGFRVSRRRVFERNTIFDTEPLSLRPSGLLLRLREAGNRFTVTFKGKATVGRHKTREELEFTLSDAETAQAVLYRLGYHATFVYEKYRTEYVKDGEAGMITLDETPIGLYMELEGDELWIDSTAKSLEVADKDYLTASYGALYLRWCESRGCSPAHMVFLDPA
jgi:adenylate cyclase, class 2